MKKYIEGNQVAVLINPNYGAGWSTWASQDAEQMLFDADIVKLVLNKAPKSKIKETSQQKWPDNFYGGIDGLLVVWIPIGTQFRVEEYDGSESIIYNSEDFWITA